MDAIDGGQARRTKSSSPLGQLFDHGCDGILSGMAPILQMHALGLGLGPELPLMIALTQCLFFMSMWEEKYTGVCRTTIFGVVGTTEFMLAFVFHQLLCGMYPEVSHGLKNIVTYITYIGAACSAATSLYSVSAKERSFRPLFELAGIFLVNASFLQFAPKISFAPFLLQAFTNSYLIIRMIVCSMSKTEWSNQWTVILPVALLARFASEAQLVAALAAYTAFYVFFLKNGCTQIARALNIKVFSIVTPSKST